MSNEQMPSNALQIEMPPNVDEGSVAFVTVSQLRETVAAAVARERKAGEDRVQFTKERWEIECKSQVEIEREACAKVVVEESGRWAIPLNSTEYLQMWEECAAAIRARGQA